MQSPLPTDQFRWQASWGGTAVPLWGPSTNLRARVQPLGLQLEVQKDADPPWTPPQALQTLQGNPKNTGQPHFTTKSSFRAYFRLSPSLLQVCLLQWELGQLTRKRTLTVTSLVSPRLSPLGSAWTEKQNSTSKTHNFSAQTESQMKCLKIRIMCLGVFSLKFKMYFSQSNSLKRLKQVTIPPLATALKNEIILRDMTLPFSEQVLIKGWQSDPQKKTGFLAHSPRQLQLFEAPFTAEWRVQLLWAVSISTSDH